MMVKKIAVAVVGFFLVGCASKAPLSQAQSEASAARAEPAVDTPAVDSSVIDDFLKNSSERVDIKNSNSQGCPKPCSVSKYLSFHSREMTKHLQKAKRAKADASTSWKSRCDRRGLPDMPKTFVEADTCCLYMGFAEGEHVYSEQLCYLRGVSDKAVIPGTFRAVGTP